MVFAEITKSKRRESLACIGRLMLLAFAPLQALSFRAAAGAEPSQECIIVPVSAAGGATGGGASSPCSDDGSVIDMLVVYTQRARVAGGGAEEVEMLIRAAEAETNQIYIRSGITPWVRVVLTREINYDEYEDIPFGSYVISEALARLRDPTDFFMDEVHTWRNAVAADVVSLIGDSSAVCNVGVG